MCFWCNEKYTEGHYCKNHKLMVLLVQECEVTDDVEHDLPIEELPIEEPKMVYLSLNSIVG